MKSTHSSVVTTRTDGRIKSGKTATEQSLTDYYSNTRDTDDFPDFPDIPNTSKQHKEDSDMYTDPAERRRRGRGGVIYLSARTAIYSTWLPPQPRGLTATLSRVKPGVEWHGVAQTPGEYASARWHQSWRDGGSNGGEDRWHACRSVRLREGGAFLKRGSLSFAEECVYSCVWKAAAVSHAIKERPHDTHAGILYVCGASHRQRRVVTLADRRLHSLRPPSGLHQSVLLFNNSTDTCRL